MTKSKAQSGKKKQEDEYFETLADASGSDVDQDDEEENNENQEQQGDEKDKKPIKIKTIVRKPQPKLDATRLNGQRGLDCLLQIFEKFKSKGENHEFQDLNNMIAKYEYWSHRLFPKMKFVDVIERLEKLGEKREVKNKMNTLRMGVVNENNVEHDPALEDEEMTSRVMEMMKNVNASESESEIEHTSSNVISKAPNKTAPKVIEYDDEDNTVESQEKRTNSDEIQQKNNKVVADEEEDEDALFTRLLNENNILKNL